MDLEDLSRAMRTGPKLEEDHVKEMIKANAVINRDAKSLRDRVIQLHERMMGHPNVEAMCLAVDGDAPTWNHSELKYQVKLEA